MLSIRLTFRDRNFLAGLSLGVAFSAKIYPLALLPLVALDFTNKLALLAGFSLSSAVINLSIAVFMF